MRVAWDGDSGFRQTKQKRNLSPRRSPKSNSFWVAPKKNPFGLFGRNVRVHFSSMSVSSPMCVSIAPSVNSAPARRGIRTISNEREKFFGCSSSSRIRRRSSLSTKKKPAFKDSKCWIPSFSVALFLRVIVNAWSGI